ncbi:MAG TPA: class III lanthionine synthetase LanKC [Longimicrobium sp.]|nr:class III lanthionine synthetase LanKC [Longimicrobium sp.]
MSDNATYSLLDREFFIPLEEKALGPEYRSRVVERLGGDGWTVLPRGVWTHALPAGWSGPRQGWKLHVSATPAGAPEVLDRVLPVLAADPAAFKFASDKAILYVMLSKNWPREGGGKFLTVYPRDEAHFQRLAQALARATDGLDGPYILSDRRVPGSRVVFYRYGEHLPLDTVDARGVRVQKIVGPEGQTVSDARSGYYRLPEWVDDPYGARPVQVVDSPEALVTLNGRYRVRAAIRYSNLGGVYYGTDLEQDRPVVVRERRPGTGWIDDATDAVALLDKETRILRRMDGTGLTPGFVDAFQVWEHRYLVMEHVDGVPLRDWALARYFKRRGLGSPRRLFYAFRRVILELLRGMEAFHREGIVIRDLTVHNVLVRRDGSLCFIDLEYAWERGGELAYAAGINTPGYASPEQMDRLEPTEADDYYALGAVIVEMCSFLASGLRLNREGTLDAARIMMDELGVPGALLEIAEGLLAPDPAARWGAAEVRRALAAVRPARIPWRARAAGRATPLPPADRAPEDTADRVGEACEEVCAFFEASARPQRTRALWPASADADRLNTVCVQLGACGPLEYVRRARGGVPEAWLEWVERAAAPERCPPGLYVGLAGVALTLAACGRDEAARRAMDAAAATPLLPAHPGLYHGAAGVGVAALALGARWDDAELLALAARTGEELAAAARPRAGGLAWPDAGGRVVPCGLAAGGSGIALFYTYLGAATGEPRWWGLARRALDYELAQVTRHAGYALWPDAGGRRRGRGYRSPHVYFGSAGVATAALRLHACTGDAELLPWIAECARAITLRWTNKLWQDMGFAGWGETLLDLHALTGDEEHRRHALRIAEVLLATRVRTRLGTAFPGGGLDRVAADYGMGTSGIALFLHRLAHPGTARAFYPDHLLPGWPATAWSTGAATPAPAAASAPGTSGPAAAPRPAGRARARARARTPA